MPTVGKEAPELVSIESKDRVQTHIWMAGTSENNTPYISEDLSNLTEQSRGALEGLIPNR